MIDSKLDELLEKWEVCRTRGEQFIPEELCGSDLELRDILLAQIDGLECMAWMDEDEDSNDEDPHDRNDSVPGKSGRHGLPPTRLNGQQFLTALNRAGLLTDTAVQEILQDAVAGTAQENAMPLAEQLVDHGQLTAYQASVVLDEGTDRLVIDRYVILDILGRGGMGIVYKALHKSMERVVALKCLPPNAVDSVEKVTRFQREVKAAASLSHPNIVTVFDAAEVGGAHFLAMEFVDGQDLFSIVDNNGPLPINRAVQFVRDAAIGLHHAHGQGIIHRDIKPANLIVSSDNIVKIADLGLATTGATAAELDQQLTQSNVVLGTIAYLSPEQAHESCSTDARADIYSLGATLYFLLTGRPPFNDRSAVQTLIAHRERMPTALIELRPGAGPEVNAICLRMLAKDPDDRFQSMQDVAAALDALDLADVPERGVNAEKIATLEDTGPVAAAGVTTEIISPTRDRTSNEPKQERGGNLPKWLLTGALVFLSAVVIIIKNKDGSETRIDLGDAKSISIKTDRQELEIDLVDGKTIEVGVPQRNAASSLWNPGPVDQVLPGLVVKPKQRPGVRRWQIDLSHATAPTNSMAWHPNGRLVACATSHGDIRLLDAESLELVRLLPGHHRNVTCVAWSPDGLLASSSWDGTVRLWNADGLQGPVLQGHSTDVLSVAWSHDGKWLASTGRRGTVRLWTRDGTAGPVLDGHTGTVWCAAYNPASPSVVTGGSDGQIRLWSLDGTPGRVIKDDRGAILEIVWIDNESFAVLAGNTLRTWRTDGTAGPLFEGHTQQIFDVAISPGGRQVATAGRDRTLRLWLPDGSPQSTITMSNSVRAAAWSPDARRVLSYCNDGGLRIHSAAGKLLTKVLPEDDSCPHSVAVSPDGRLVASGYRNGCVRLIGADGIQRATHADHSDRVTSIAWNPNGENFASSSADLTVRIQQQDGSTSAVLEGHTATVVNVAWSPDGKWLATGSSDKSVRLWQPDGTAGPVLDGHTGGIYAVAWSPDSQHIVSASLDETVRVWNVDGTHGPTVAVSERLLAVDWSPDGKQIAIGSTDGMIRTYPTDGTEPKPASIDPGTSTYCYDVQWNHDGSRLATAHGDGKVRFWKVDGSSAGHIQTRGEVIDVNWSADGQRIALANGGRTVALYDVNSQQPLWTAVALADGQVATLTPDGELLNADKGDCQNELVYIVEHNDGRLETLKTSEF